MFSRIYCFYRRPSNPGPWIAENLGNQKPFLSSCGLGLQLSKSVQKSVAPSVLYFLKAVSVELPATAQAGLSLGVRHQKRTVEFKQKGLQCWQQSGFILYTLGVVPGPLSIILCDSGSVT